VHFGLAGWFNDLRGARQWAHTPSTAIEGVRVKSLRAIGCAREREAAAAAVSLPVAVPRGTRRPFAASFYFQMSRMCGSTFFPNNSSASISSSGSSEPGGLERQIDDAGADLFAALL
jgi:hypothetical protein